MPLQFETKFDVRDSDPPWKVQKDSPRGVMITVLRNFTVLPWCQFMYVTGTDATITAYWTTHEIVITGMGLTVLAECIRSQSVSAIGQSARNEVMQGAGAYIETMMVTLRDAD